MENGKPSHLEARNRLVRRVATAVVPFAAAVALSSCTKADAPQPEETNIAGIEQLLSDMSPTGNTDRATDGIPKLIKLVETNPNSQDVAKEKAQILGTIAGCVVSTVKKAKQFGLADGQVINGTDGVQYFITAEQGTPDKNPDGGDSDGYITNMFGLTIADNDGSITEYEVNTETFSRSLARGYGFSLSATRTNTNNSKEAVIGNRISAISAVDKGTTVTLFAGPMIDGKVNTLDPTFLDYVAKRSEFAANDIFGTSLNTPTKSPTPHTIAE